MVVNDAKIFVFSGGDSDNSFGGGIEPYLFTNANLFEDAATHNQLDTLTAGLTIPGDTTAGGAPGKDTLTASMAAEVIDVLGPKSTSSAAPLGMATPRGVHGGQMPPPAVSANMTTGTARDNTTLIGNDLEAFALLPVDAPATLEPRRCV